MKRTIFIILALLSATLIGCQSEEGGTYAQDPDNQKESKVVEHALGKTEVPVNPERVVVIGLEDMMLSLEIPMLAATGVEGQYLYDLLKEEDIHIIGTVGAEYNFEAILDQEPDIIVASESPAGRENVYERLTQIAPTITYDREDWRESIKAIGSVFGKGEKADQVIQTLDEKLEKAKKKVTDSIGEDQTVAFIRPTNKDVQVFFPGYSYTSVLYDELGFTTGALVSELQENEEEGAWGSVVSLEKMPELTADYLFVTVGSSLATIEDNEQASLALEEAKKLPVWQGIPAVQQERVYVVSPRHWMLNGPIAESRKIDDVVEALTTN
ncbi:iron complex transport system substrate-binding protein [Natronobacillus azotifigens]|uniref:ABC transporter substrate-binding protein n=1 Tax=Natronobacillus azotifigens TaxID=472978 RepID=A0A9J6REJ5_9BACI|nr:ABC transporter substrate-binding protein [Natronobacillus azotifigens]MCZ0704170.1 ABC transporter substrate-binding protein [Natronobacillus azotifigens]